MRFVRAVAQKSESSGWRAGVIVAFGIVLGMLLVGTSWSAFKFSADRAGAEASQRHTLEVLTITGDLRSGLLNALRGERGFMLIGDPEFLRPYEEGRRAALQEMRELRQATRDNPLQQKRLAALDVQVTDYLSMLDRLNTLRRSGKTELALAEIRTGETRRSTETILEEISNIERTERNLLVQRAASAARIATANERYQYLITAVGFLLLTLSIAASFAVRRAVTAEARIRRELRRIAQTDELTGLANRRELLAAMDREIAGAKRTGRPLSFAILDIDHFKQVNDTFGHPAGDVVIRTIAQRACDAMRGQDVVGRLGGEEFAIILPDCSIGAGFAACERLRSIIQSGTICLEDGQTLSITLSTGITAFRQGDDGESMMKRADAALYEAKHGGRDQVKLAA